MSSLTIVPFQVISNLIHGMERQREKQELMRTFSHWRSKQCEAREEVGADRDQVDDSDHLTLQWQGLQTAVQRGLRRVTGSVFHCVSLIIKELSQHTVHSAQPEQNKLYQQFRSCNVQCSPFNAVVGSHS